MGVLGIQQPIAQINGQVVDEMFVIGFHCSVKLDHPRRCLGRAAPSCWLAQLARMLLPLEIARGLIETL